jgi:CubicO group peptidase (beta-lactamase class C family)
MTGLAVVVAGCTDAPVAPRDVVTSEPRTSLAEHARSSDELLADSLEPDQPGCSAAAGIEGEVVWAGARGRADLTDGRPIRTSTTFDIASVSKQFTATAVLLLAADRRLDLEDPLSRWVSGLPGWADDVTLTQLVHHVSGIPDYTFGLAAAVTDRTTQQDAIDYVAAIEDLSSAPGEKFSYSNTNYVLLAEVVARASGRPLPGFARTEIFEPLGLAMVFDPEGASPDATDRTSARGYTGDPASGKWDPAGSRWGQVGDGSVQTTPSELVRWADEYRAGRLAGGALQEARYDGAVDAGGGDRYAAGIVERRDGSLWHGGGWAGFLSDFWISPDRSTAVAVTCNGDGGPWAVIGTLAPALQDEWSS